MKILFIFVKVLSSISVKSYTLISFDMLNCNGYLHNFHIQTKNRSYRTALSVTAFFLSEDCCDFFPMLMNMRISSMRFYAFHLLFIVSRLLFYCKISKPLKFMASHSFYYYFFFSERARGVR